MFYKQLGDHILCVKDNDGVILFAPDTQRYVNDNNLAWLSTDAKIVRLPDYTFVFDDDPRILEFAKTDKLAELGASFDERVAGSFETSQGYSMQFDTSDAIKMKGAIKLLEATDATEGYLTQADDTTVYNVPLDTMKAVLIEMMTAFAACHARKQELRSAIKAAETTEDLDAVVISWPV